MDVCIFSGLTDVENPSAIFLSTIDINSHVASSSGDLSIVGRPSGCGTLLRGGVVL